MEGSIDSVLDVDPAALDHDGGLELLERIEQLRSALDAQGQHALAGLAREGDAEQRAKEWVRDEVAAVLRIAPVTAAGRLHDALDLVHRLPATLDRLVDGTLTLGHARALVEHIRRLDDATTTTIETRVLRRAGDQTIGEFRAAVRRAVLTCDPASAEARHRDAVAARRVVHSGEDDGMAWIGAYLRADDAAALYATVDGLAAQLPDDRTADQKRADVLVGLADAATAGLTHKIQGRRPGVQVTVALSTLLGLDDHPGELAGHGPIPAALARAIAADPTGTWRRLVTDPLGRLIDYGQDEYRPPAPLRDYLLAEHATCPFPGCSRGTRRRDTDHVIPFAAGGPTNKDNLHPPCGRHHHLRHEGRWRIAKTSAGAIEWTSPTGRNWTTTPTEHPLDTTRGHPDDITGVPPPDDDPPPF